jgi:hypothetical protein
MKKSISYYFGAAFVMLLGLVYNVIEQDFLGSGIFLVSSIVFLSIGILKKRSFSKSKTSHNILLASCLSSPQKSRLGQILTRRSPTTFAFAPWQSVWFLCIWQ